MKDTKLQTFFEGAMSISDRLAKLEAVRAAAEEMIKSCEDIWVEQFKDGGVDNFWSAKNNLYATLKALEGEKHGKD